MTFPDLLLVKQNRSGSVLLVDDDHGRGTSFSVMVHEPGRNSITLYVTLQETEEDKIMSKENFMATILNIISVILPSLPQSLPPSVPSSLSPSLHQSLPSSISPSLPRSLPLHLIDEINILFRLVFYRC